MLIFPNYSQYCQTYTYRPTVMEVFENVFKLIWSQSNPQPINNVHHNCYAALYETEIMYCILL